MEKTHRFIRFQALLLLLIMLFSLFATAAFAQEVSVSTTPCPSYFENYTSSGSWRGIGTPLHVIDSTGQVAYCLQTNYKSPYGSGYSSIDGSMYYNQTTLNGLQAILENGYPSSDGGFGAEQARYASKAAIKAVKAMAAAVKAAVSALIAGGWAAILILIIVIIFGAVLAVFSSSGGASSPVSEEVNAYTSIIQIYAQKHGIPEYVDLIKAVMMQESGGRGNDPMQASECGFNTEYPHAPNGITDPEYSINVGVQNIAYVMSLASVQNPIDIPNISLALQAYNFGTGYIYWALDKDGGYTLENAVEFSNNMAAIMGWSNYGDSQYVPHVLRYYPLGGIMPGLGSESIVQVALSQVGNVGGQAFWSWYGFNYRVEWCACFVSWCGAQCGYIDAGVMPKFAYCPEGLQWFRDNGKFQDRNYTPTPGTIIFFDWEGDGVSDHVGIVENVDGSTIHTVEGNVRDSVVQREYPVGSNLIIGFGVI